jgi:hypothetical protein
MYLKVLFPPTDTGNVVVQEMSGKCKGLGNASLHMGVRIDLDSKQEIDGNWFDPQGHPYDQHTSFIVSPLCVVLDGLLGNVVYTPSEHVNDLPTGWQEALVHNTNWPPEKYREYPRTRRR